MFAFVTLRLMARAGRSRCTTRDAPKDPASNLALARQAVVRLCECLLVTAARPVARRGSCDVIT